MESAGVESQRRMGKIHIIPTISQNKHPKQPSHRRAHTPIHTYTYTNTHIHIHIHTHDTHDPKHSREAHPKASKPEKEMQACTHTHTHATTPTQSKPNVHNSKPSKHHTHTGEHPTPQRLRVPFRARALASARLPTYTITRPSCNTQGNQHPSIIHVLQPGGLNISFHGSS